MTKITIIILLLTLILNLFLLKYCLSVSCTTPQYTPLNPLSRGESHQINFINSLLRGGLGRCFHLINIFLSCTNILQLFILIFSLSITIISCSTDNNENIVTSENRESKKFDAYIKNATDLNSYVTDLVNKKETFESYSKLENYILNDISINDNLYGVSYLDINIYKNLKQKTHLSKGVSDKKIAFSEIGLSKKANEYFHKLYELNYSQKYSEMVELLEEYKLEYDKDSDLESLAGVFSIIEIYKKDLLDNSIAKNAINQKSRSCQGSGSALAGAAVGGAISGAIWGFKFGSLFGPAGTALGALGGALAGAVVSSIVNIGVQAIQCDNSVYIEQETITKKEIDELVLWE